MLIKFWASYEQRLPARCQTVLVFVMCPLETWWGGGGDLKTGTALLKSRMEETHRRRTAKSSAPNWSRLTKYIILRSPPFFREWDFWINKCEVGRKRRKSKQKNVDLLPREKRFQSLCEYAYSSLTCFFLRLIIYSARKLCQQKAPSRWKAPFRSVLNAPVLHHVLFGWFLSISCHLFPPQHSISSICIAFAVLDCKQRAKLGQTSRGLTARSKSALARESFLNGGNVHFQDFD